MRRPIARITISVVAAGFCTATDAPARAQEAPPAGVYEELRSLAGRGAGAVTVDAAGLTRSGDRLWVLEPAGAAGFGKPKVVLIGGLDGSAESTAAVLRVLTWWFTSPDAATLRGAWQLAALPCADPRSCGDAAGGKPQQPLTFPPTGAFFDGKSDPTAQYVWRWTTMQAPTVVVDVRVGWPLQWRANRLAVALAEMAARAVSEAWNAARATALAQASASRPIERM